MLLISCYILYAFHLHILVIYFSLSYNVLFICFFIYFIYHIHFVSLILYFLYLYTCHFLLGFMSANTLEVDTGK